MIHTGRIHQRICSLVFLAVLVTIGGAVSTAQAAQDFKTYPGSYCRPADMDSPDVRYSGHRVFNRSSSKWLTVYCPIVRDMMSANAKWTKVVIFYQNPDPSNRITCRMANRGPDGTLFKYYENSGSSADGLMRIYSDRSGAGIASYTLTCFLPKYTGQGLAAISLIQVQEAS